MKNIAEQLANFFRRLSQKITSKELLKMTDSRLTDIGLSRRKLKLGAAEYPWKIETDVVILKFSVKQKITPVVAIKQETKVAACSS